MTPRRRLALLVAAAVAGAALSSDAARRAYPVTVSRTGIEPAELHVRRDEGVQLEARSEDGEHCLAIDAFRVEKRLLPGRTVTIRFTPDANGRFPVHCCLGGDHAAERRSILLVGD